MIVTTTSSLEGKTIKKYIGVVFGEVICGIDFARDFTVTFANFAGGRATEYEEELVNARAEAIQELIHHAEKVGANALVGVKVDCESITKGENGEVMLMVNATGTAVIAE